MKTSGRELPRNYNHVLLAELFPYHSKEWRNIAIDHLADIFGKVKEFLDNAVHYISVDDQVSAETLDLIGDLLDESK